jgi:cell division septation protein DedD
MAQPLPVNANPPPVPPQPVQREVLVTPHLPDANDGKIYRLQVGAFLSPEPAAEIVLELKGYGFNVILEAEDSFYRVTVTDIPAAMVYYAVQRLGTVGFRQIWVIE